MDNLELWGGCQGVLGGTQKIEEKIKKLIVFN